MKKYITILMALALVFSSCEDWLDVKPSKQIEASRLFEDEQGFKDALYGVYTGMISHNLYGRELTFGMVDVLGAVYTEPGGSTAYTNLMAFNYENQNAEAVLTAVWKEAYNVIANINSLIDAFDGADEKMFQPDNREVILGEALALRAMLHFDMLRLYAPSWIAGKDKQGIPYVTKYSYQLTGFSTVSQAVGKIMEDLTDASELLKASDPIITGREINSNLDNGYLLDRPFRMNYYAVRALMARLAMWQGDTGNAYKYAKEVISSSAFRWTTQSEIATLNDYDRNRTFTPEQVFTLYVEGMSDLTYGYFSATSPMSNLMSSMLWTMAVYSSPAHTYDWRNLYLWSGSVSGKFYEICCTKLVQPEKMPEAFVNRMPIIRLPEMYLIAAEASLAEGLGGELTLLNTMRANRGVAGQLSDMTPEQIENEIMMEYLREYSCEGIMFYYYKRKNADYMYRSYTAMDKSKYVLPIPVIEFEYRPQTGN